MKQNGISLNTLLKGEQISLAHLSEEEIGDEHAFTSTDTPLRPDAFDKGEEEKMAIIEKHFRAIMDTLGLDLTDDSLKGTPKRVAKMYVQEIFSGLNPANKPKVALFENKYRYDQMLLEKDITFYSNCEHHFVPIFGKAHVAYISNGTVIGLSKLNRIVQYFAKRPQVQERLTSQIADAMVEVLNPAGVIVVIDCEHLCMSMRGVRKSEAKTITSAVRGQLRDPATRAEAMSLITSNNR